MGRIMRVLINVESINFAYYWLIEKICRERFFTFAKIIQLHLDTGRLIAFVRLFRQDYRLDVAI